MASSADLGQRLETYVSDLVKNGRYNSRSEVLQEGVRLVEEREKKVAALDTLIRRGIADADSGKVKPMQDVVARLCSKYDQMNKERDM